jgi:hypothetical protein
MIARGKLEVVLSAAAPETEVAPLSSITVERIAVVSVIGTLVSRSGYLDAASGLASYADIGDAIGEAMADPKLAPTLNRSKSK